MTRSLTLGIGAACLIAAVTGTTAPAIASENHASTSVASSLKAPKESLSAVSDTPPGESGDFPIADQATYEANSDPSDFGPHVDDQRETYWDFKYKADNFAKPTGTPVEPISGLKIYRDSQGVPLIYGKNGYDVWYGDGFAAATDRLFEMDAIRRTANGTLAQLTGADQVPADLEEQTVTYTNAEYMAMYRKLPKASRVAIAAYSAGAEARIKQVNADPTALAPGEDILLSTDTVDPTDPETVADWTIADTVAAGVYITRDIASQGGEEMANVEYLRQLQKTYGHKAGRRVFNNLFTDNDPKAVVTIHGKTFSNLPKDEQTAKGRLNAQTNAENYAERLPLALANGPGTGDSPVPSPTGTAMTSSTDVKTVLPTYNSDVLAAANRLEQWSHGLHGGSFAYAVSGKRTKNGKPMLASDPQLAYSYPSELYEIEVHGGGYNARGVGVPGIPTVGIGHSAKVAWALTTGYSKTIDSFIETTRANPKSTGPPQYLHDGKWHNEACRKTTIYYRALSPEGVPAGTGDGPGAPSVTDQICRTDHGPIVATADHGKLARSVDYAMWKHEVDTITGILDWDKAKNLADIVNGVKHVTWNENIIAATAGGDIGYWHPGRYFHRAPGTDQRFPLKGTGSQDERGLFSYNQMPHVIDPKDGYVANWNTKPAHGWYDGDLSGSNTRPGGPANRLLVVEHQIRNAHNATAASMVRWDRNIGESDDRAIGYLPIMRAELHDKLVTSTERKALQLLKKWNGHAYAPGHGSSPLGTAAANVTDGPAPTLFAAWVDAIRSSLFGSLSPQLLARLNSVPSDGTHAYDLTPLDNLALRTLRPGFSGVPALARWAHGRSRSTIMRSSLAAAIKTLDQTYGSKLSSWRRAHAISPIESLTGVVGPSVDMPFEDRGTWVQHVVFH